jgi:phosphatidylethanolamine-binding protein (PEBP) family uncharacterized protein
MVVCSFVHCIVCNLTMNKTTNSHHRGRLQTIQWTKLQTTVNRGRLQTIQWTKLQTTVNRGRLQTIQWLSVTFLEIVVCSFVHCIACNLPRFTAVCSFVHCIVCNLPRLTAVCSFVHTNNRKSRKVTDNTMDKTTNNRQSRKVTDTTMDKTTNNYLEEGYRQYNGHRSVCNLPRLTLFVVLSIVLSVTFLEIVGCSFVHCIVCNLPRDRCL